MTNLRKFNAGAEYSTAERCRIVELLGRAEDGTCSIARVRVEAGVTTQLHALSGVAERYVILEGTGLMEIGRGSSFAVGPLDVVCIPAGEAQRITNTGSSDLTFLCICTPPFEARAYQNLEA